MANYCGTARSNYFRVKDKQKFAEWCNSLELEPIYTKDDLTKDELCGFLVNTEYGSIPNFRMEGDECIDIDFIIELSTHLTDGEVAIVMEIGAEKMRYLQGFAEAVNSKGETAIVTLDDIYDKAKILGSNITDVSY